MGSLSIGGFRSLTTAKKGTDPACNGLRPFPRPRFHDAWATSKVCYGVRLSHALGCLEHLSVSRSVILLVSSESPVSREVLIQPLPAHVESTSRTPTDTLPANHW